jgi:hypothetical protein
VNAGQLSRMSAGQLKISLKNYKGKFGIISVPLRDGIKEIALSYNLLLMGRV